MGFVVLILHSVWYTDFIILNFISYFHKSLEHICYIISHQTFFAGTLSYLNNSESQQTDGQVHILIIWINLLLIYLGSRNNHCCYIIFFLHVMCIHIYSLVFKKKHHKLSPVKPTKVDLPWKDSFPTFLFCIRWNKMWKIIL